jgi:Glycosyltransferase sugar-binding region containing DXD motif
MKTVIQGLWIGDALSTMEKLSISSYIEHGHDYHLYIYNDVSGVPPQTIIKDANEILPSAMITRCDAYGSYAGFADYFRYKLLLEKGGYWSDLDIVCIKPLNFEDAYVFSSENNASGIEKVTNALIKAPKGSRLLRFASEIAGAKDLQKLQWGEIGPYLLQDLVRRLSLDEYVKSASTFCPIPPHRFYEALLPGYCNGFSEQTHTVHLYNEMWRRLGVYKDEIYAPTCLYERLKEKYLPVATLGNSNSKS